MAGAIVSGWEIFDLIGETLEARVRTISWVCCHGRDRMLGKRHIDRSNNGQGGRGTLIAKSRAGEVYQSTANCANR